MKVRVKEGNRYGAHGPGTELDLDERDVAQHPHCFEAADAHLKRLHASRLKRLRFPSDLQRQLGLTPTGAPEGDVYELVRLDEGVKERSELERLLKSTERVPAGPISGERARRLEALLVEVARRMDHDPGENPDALRFVEENISQVFAHIQDLNAIIKRGRDEDERLRGQLAELRRALQVAHSEVEKARTDATRLSQEVAQMKAAATSAEAKPEPEPKKKRNEG